MPGNFNSILPSSIGTTYAIIELIKDMQSAPFDITSFKRELTELCPILEALYKIYGQNSDPVWKDVSSNASSSSSSDAALTTGDLKLDVERSLESVLMGCYTVLQASAKLLESYCPQKGASKKSSLVRQSDRLRWTVDGREKAERLRQKLESSKSTLNIAMNLARQYEQQMTGKRVDLVYYNTQLIQQQVHEVLKKLNSRDREEASSIIASAPSEYSMMLRRYLESASTYAESIADTDRYDEEGSMQLTRPNSVVGEPPNLAISALEGENRFIYLGTKLDEGKSEADQDNDGKKDHDERKEDSNKDTAFNNDWWYYNLLRDDPDKDLNISTYESTATSFYNYGRRAHKDDPYMSDDLPSDTHWHSRSSVARTMEASPNHPDPAPSIRTIQPDDEPTRSYQSLNIGSMWRDMHSIWTEQNAPSRLLVPVRGRDSSQRVGGYDPEMIASAENAIKRLITPDMIRKRRPEP